MRSGLSFVWSELLPGTALRAAKSPSIRLTVYIFPFPPYSFRASMHRNYDVRPPLPKCRQVATTGQLCGGLSGMCGVPAFGHTKKCFSASGNWCKVSRYCVYVFLSFISTACVQFANINCKSSKVCWDGGAGASLVFPFCKNRAPLVQISNVASNNNNVTGCIVDNYTDEPIFKWKSPPTVSWHSPDTLWNVLFATPNPMRKFRYSLFLSLNKRTPALWPDTRSVSSTRCSIAHSAST